MKKERNGFWMELYSGIRFYPFDPIEEEINIIDIAHALSNICRFSGHTKEFYSVGQHCILVSEICNDKLEGLLHDASEAYLSDVPRPVKMMLPEYKECELGLMKVISNKYDLKFPIPENVHIADEIMLEREHRHILNFGLNWTASESNSWIKDDKFSDFEGQYNKKITSWSPIKVENKFLELFEEFSNGR